MRASQEIEPSLGTKSQLFNGKVNERGTFGPIEDQAYQTQTEDTPKYIDTEDLEALSNPE